MNIARDYANNVDLRLAGWKVIRLWECDVMTKDRRVGTLQRLYAEITAGASRRAAYAPTPPVVTEAAEPATPYGDTCGQK